MSKRLSDLLKEKARMFSVQVVELSREVRKHREAVLSAQVLRSGTSIGANIAEAAYAQTRGDALSKHSIAQKEAAETLYWIELFMDTGIIEAGGRFEPMRRDCIEIIGILDRVIRYLKYKNTRCMRERISNKTKGRGSAPGNGN